MQEWYLIGNTTKPNMTGGYENDAFNDFKNDAFSEVLDSPIGKTIRLYNSSMTEYKTIQCIVQDNTASTQLKSLERTILSKIGTLKAGMYVLFEGRYWLITGYPGNNGIYEKATMVLCQYKLKWQLDNGRIIERWANFTSASKYDVGESGNTTIVLSSNNFTVWVSEDDDSFTLDGKRVFIDRSKENPKKVFKITRSDDVLYIYGEEHGGILSFIADRDELNPNKDRSDIGICDYHSPTIEGNESQSENISTSIIGNDKLKIGFDRTYSATFTDKSENVIYPNFTWNIVSDFEVKQELIENKIKLLVNDEDYISSSFLLQVIIDNKVLSEKTISVIEGF
ncbi:MAG: hypothetical protein ACLRPZ_04115 [Coprococcus sp.]